MARPVLAVDLDEVLGPFVRQFAAFLNEAEGTAFSEADFSSYYFSDCLPYTHDEVMDRIHRFFESRHFLLEFPAFAEAQAVLRVLHAHFRVCLVTSRQHIIEQATRDWIAAHFGGVFDELLFGNHYGVSGEKRSKRDMCADIGAAALVDDSLHYVAEVAPIVKTAVLYGDYGWNRSQGDLPPNVVRLSSWKQVGEHLASTLIDDEGERSSAIEKLREL